MFALDVTDEVYPETGFEEIDREHRALDAIARRLMDAVREDDYERVCKRFDELLAGTLLHFDHEEQLMRAIGYPALARHKATHEAFLMRARAARERLNVARLDSGFLKWMTSTGEWFGTHVTTEDLWLAMALNEALARPSAAIALVK